MARLRTTYSGRLRVVLALAVSIALLTALPAAASAQDTSPSAPPAGPAAVEGDVGTMAVVSHRCHVIGTSGGIQAVHCADLDRFTNSGGRPAIRGQALSYCQRTDGTPVACTWVRQSVSIVNRTNGDYGRIVFNECGIENTCSTSRLRALSPGLFVYCGHTYYSTVISDIQLPNGSYYSLGLDSYYYTPTTNCIRS